ncbi:MAG: acetyl-CoA carboxylase biotin carboxylase subunit [Deltaproteobacteria bacterium RBG_19FT_COMBO_52_11]|nr:MAG: acetyl-CoA carboxylase biotin carboxylase subunit [Deltaproteobacteria bacterium RBG_19FT_COMBO_52_11]
MFSKILIANRGEIAVRIIRACQELGIHTVAVYSEADLNSLHVRLADEKLCIGSPMSRKSYLNIENIIAAAKATKAEAIHPGYGYLAENGQFAKRCASEGLVFIGPTPENLDLAGDKITAKSIMEKAGIPIIPCSRGTIDTLEEAVRFCKKIGYPVMIKATAGGGGRGIRICTSEEILREEFAVARMEARAAFGHDGVYIEKGIVDPRHVEFQILADQWGTIIHLGERDCSIQRRYQKLVEESPSPRLTPQLRLKMGETAIAAAKAVKYFNAGTVEFLLDQEDQFYFMEINARIQVEHPVTELVTGIDLIKEQIRLASGERLGYRYEDLKPRGWAIECRINAEDPERNFLPCPGVIEEYHPPGGFGIRLDTHIYQGYELPMFYDSLIGKLVSYDLTRDGAIQIMKRALKEFRVKPIKTTIPLYLKIMDDPFFRQGQFSTSFIKKFLPEEEDET